MTLSCVLCHRINFVCSLSSALAGNLRRAAPGGPADLSGPLAGAGAGQEALSASRPAEQQVRECVGDRVGVDVRVDVCWKLCLVNAGCCVYCCVLCSLRYLHSCSEKDVRPLGKCLCSFDIEEIS